MCIKDDLKAFKIPVQNCETLTKCRLEWSRLVKGGSEIFERERIDHAELKRNLRKGNVSVLPNALNSWKCEACNRMLHSKAGYIRMLLSKEGYIRMLLSKAIYIRMLLSKAGYIRMLLSKAVYINHRGSREAEAEMK